MINVGDKTEPAGTPRAAVDLAATTSFDILTRFLLSTDFVSFFSSSIIVFETPEHNYHLKRNGQSLISILEIIV